MYINFEKWLARCNTCEKRNVCRMRDVMSNQRVQANCYKKGDKNESD